MKSTLANETQNLELNRKLEKSLIKLGSTGKTLLELYISKDVSKSASYDNDLTVTVETAGEIFVSTFDGLDPEALVASDGKGHLRIIPFENIISARRGKHLKPKVINENIKPYPAPLHLWVKTLDFEREIKIHKMLPNEIIVSHAPDHSYTDYYITKELGIISYKFIEQQ